MLEQRDRRERDESSAGTTDRSVRSLSGAGCAVLDTVSARLSTISLRALDAQVELCADDPRLVAESWLRAQGLASAGEASH